jgi:hypothetical protein
MPPPAAGEPVIDAGYVQAAAAALAALAILAVAASLTGKRLAWETWFDMPVGLSTPPGTGTGTPLELHLAEPGLYHPGLCADSSEQGWIVPLGITNPGCARVRGRDFLAADL